MKRGEIWTAAAGSGYAGKPRPVVIVQDDLFAGTASVTICAFTTDPTDAPLLRLLVATETHRTRGPTFRPRHDPTRSVDCRVLGSGLSLGAQQRLGNAIAMTVGGAHQLT